jgi:hypothetical protein
MNFAIRNKRINADDRAVFDVYRADRFIATVEIHEGHSGGMKVLLGALQPAGKALVLEAIRAA